MFLFFFSMKHIANTMQEEFYLVSERARAQFTICVDVLQTKLKKYAVRCDLLCVLEVFWTRNFFFFRDFDRRWFVFFKFKFVFLFRKCVEVWDFYFAFLPRFSFRFGCISFKCYAWRARRNCVSSIECELWVRYMFSCVHAFAQYISEYTIYFTYCNAIDSCYTTIRNWRKIKSWRKYCVRTYRFYGSKNIQAESNFEFYLFWIWQKWMWMMDTCVEF